MKHLSLTWHIFFLLTLLKARLAVLYTSIPLHTVTRVSKASLPSSKHQSSNHTTPTTYYSNSYFHSSYSYSYVYYHVLLVGGTIECYSMHQVTWRAGDIAIKVRDFADRPCKRIGPRVAKEIFKPQKGYEWNHASRQATNHRNLFRKMATSLKINKWV